MWLIFGSIREIIGLAYRFVEDIDPYHPFVINGAHRVIYYPPFALVGLHDILFNKNNNNPRREITMAAGFPSTAHWRDSARSARFFMVDARAAFPIFLFLMHIKVWTGVLVLVSAVFFGIIEHYGFTVPVFLRWLRSVFAGPIKSSQPWWR